MIGTQCFLVTMVLQVKSVNLGFIYHFAMIWISLVLFYSAMKTNTFIIYLGVNIACNLFFQRSGNAPDARKWSSTKPSCIGWRQFRPWPLRFLWRPNFTLTGFLRTLREHFSLRRQVFHSRTSCWESICVKTYIKLDMCFDMTFSNITWALSKHCDSGQYPFIKMNRMHNHCYRI